MAKWFGEIGYAAETVETRPGVWEEQITEHSYYGDVIQNSRRLQSSTELNDNINVSNRISIVSDPFINEHFYSMRYVTFMGVKWKVSNVEVQYPRLVLTLGGIYNDGK